MTLDSLRLSWEMRDEHQFDGFFGLTVEGEQRTVRVATVVNLKQRLIHTVTY